MHTDLKVGKFWGEMGVDFWNAAIWKEKLDQYEVFVMTPQILLDNLRHSFFKLDDIKLLIFDECHRAKGRSPYACILTEFYHRHLNSTPVDLPRIFGMTASPINSKGRSDSGVVYSKQIFELETLMDSKVYTVASESELSQYIPFSAVKIKLYQHWDIPSVLYIRVTKRLENLKLKHLQGLGDVMLSSAAEESARKRISRLHATFIYCLSHLGLWLAAKAAESLSRKETYLFFWGEKKDELGENTVRLFSQAVFEVLSEYVSKDRCIGDDFKADIAAGLITTKVHCLVQSLIEYRTVQDLRCILFVERVITAIVLQSLLCNISQLSGWGIQYIAGNNSGLQSQSRNEQMKIVDAFRSAKVNIIVATQVLEEGLDVPSCKLVVRFDPSTTVCSFIQSRGRARMRNSDYLLIVDRADSANLSKLASFLKSGDIMREESLKLAATRCKPLDTPMFKEEYYRVKTTGAIVTLSSSVALIYFYCAKLPSDGYAFPIFLFVIEESGVCTLYLPKGCPIETIHAEGERNLLKQIVCLEACKKLHEIGALTDYLLPECVVQSDDGDQDTAIESYRDDQPDYFPGELIDSWFAFFGLGLYHCYKIMFDQSSCVDAAFRDMILVVKSDLGSDFVNTSFNLEGIRDSLTVNLKYIGVIHLSREQVTMAKRFQTTVLSVLIHHDVAKLNNISDCPPKELPSTEVVYLLLPLIAGKVDWPCIKSAVFSAGTVGSQDAMSCCCRIGVARFVQTIDGHMCSCQLQNSLVYTPHNHHFYCVTGILNDLNANSHLKLKCGDVLTYKNYYKTRHHLDLICDWEPLLAGRQLLKVQNFLLRLPFRKEKESSGVNVELPPELCRVILPAISVDTLCSFSFAPSIMHRIQCLLLASRLKKILLGHCVENVNIPAIKLLEAMTTKKCREEYSLESLEALGDSFLKYASSHYLFQKYQHHHEGILSAKKDKIISNAALCRLGCAHDLPGYIRDEEFNPKKWVIPGFHYDSNDGSKMSSSNSKYIYIRQRRSIKSKRVADSVEALIGAYLSTAGESAALIFMKSIGMEIEFHKQMVVEKPVLANPEMLINVKQLEELLNYKFNDPSLLVEALTHGSYQMPDIPRCYQRLEFLGDAVLDHLSTVYLFYKYPGISPGLLTDLRSASVNNDCYAHAAVKAGLHKHIRHASSALHRQMTFYLENFGQPSSGSSYGWESGVALPKVLGDVIESLAGAIYVDSGCNKETVWTSIKLLLEPIVTPETIEYHPVRELNELCSRKSYKKSYIVTHQNGVPP
uniref:Uncharacterized protein n=1 Tax=Ananas comosus var. bracteatus TaxID=296719 RepID=A0A6V7NNV7_ANACO|nr:unnamed protein product [Ananas comosus var. bracteatus]